MNNPKTCPECGMPLVQCDNCEEYGCPDCNEEWVVTSDESVLCPECSADIRAEYNKATENGTKVCGSCACFKKEDANGVGECEYPEDHKNRTNCLDINHGSNYCENWTKKTERDPATQNITAPAPRGKKIARKLSRREWFAGMALQGIMASNDCGIGHIPEKAAQWAVRVADAICRELDAPEE